MGDRAPFGCSLPSELSCSSAKPCESPALSCSLDGVCRKPCQGANDCPRNEHECILGACVTKNDPGWQTLKDAALAMCGETTSERCEGSSYQKCEAGAAGWREIANCGANACTLPGGRCLEQLAKVDDATSEGNLSLSDGQLYWLGDAGGDTVNLYTLPPEPGASVSVVMSVTGIESAVLTLSGGLVATISAEQKVEMYRASDGTALVSVPLLSGSSMVGPPMPTGDGVFWFEASPSAPDSPANLVFAALDAEAGQIVGTAQLGPLGGSRSRSCGDAQLLYFLDAYDTLFRATPDGVEALMGLVRAVACRDNDVLVSTSTSLMSLKPDGTQKKLLDFSFTDLQVVGNKVIGNSASADQQLWVGDLATGTTEPVFTLLPQHVTTAPVAADDDYVYFFGVDQKSLVRASWH